ncbi:DUF5359 family protein [Caldalkalibacillus salinus]|uniref:DUF5359 family protein n=1 Tax=Caldalkalibacillus salinus TaxID=2803787 RepID=UPI0019229246|nr:DUF5359 family protein [Caldalkalibacillus salinus]
MEDAQSSTSPRQMVLLLMTRLESYLLKTLLFCVMVLIIVQGFILPNESPQHHVNKALQYEGVWHQNQTKAEIVLKEHN